MLLKLKTIRQLLFSYHPPVFISKQTHSRFLVCGVCHTWRVPCINALRFVLVALENLLKALLCHEGYESFDSP